MEKRANRGFTLLELTIVLVLASLILGLAAVFLANTLSSSRFKSTAREISATLRQARMLAQINGSKQTVFFEPASKTYGIEGRPGRTLPVGVELQVIDPRTGVPGKERQEIHFQPNWYGESRIIQLTHKNRTIRIELDPVVGSVIVQ